MIEICRICLIIAIMLVCRCAEYPTTAGGGLDTESSGGRLVGAVVYSDGSKGNNTLVRLLPYACSPFDQFQLITTITDSAGTYYFENLDSGLFNLEAVSLDSGSRLLHMKVAVHTNESLSAGVDTLHRPGSVLVNVHDSIGTALFYVPGTSIQKLYTGTGTNVLFDSVPSGIALPIVFRRSESSDDILLVEGITVAPGEFFRVGNDPWVYSKLFRLNTSAVSLNSDLISVPLLIRFTSENMTFSQIRSGGDDIRFSKPDGTPLSYQIERWDAVNEMAEVWVNLDTLYGNSSSQTILMQWGNGDSINRSSPVAFDTGNGFRGVWHICEERDGIRNRGLYRDGTILGNHGDDYIHARGREGMIGYGKQFNGIDDYIVIHDTGAAYQWNEPFTLSLWFNKVVAGEANLITCVGNANGRTEWGVISDSDNGIIVYAIEGDLTDTILVSETLPLTEWHHLCVVKTETESVKLFINGTYSSEGIYRFTTPDSDSGQEIYIGSAVSSDLVPGNVLNGYIDEVRIESVPRTPAWILLNYLNQMSPFLLFSE